MRFLVVLATLATLLGGTGPTGPTGPTGSAAPAPDSSPVPAPGDRAAVLEALTVLHDWDARRARAWAHADGRELRALYLPGTPAAGADVRLLRRYTRRHQVVRRLVTQVFAAEVLRRAPGVIRLRVLDRVAGGEVRRHGVSRLLPSSPPARRTVELRRVGTVWRVAEVRAVSGSGRAPRAARR